MKGNEEKKKNLIHVTAEEISKYEFRKRLIGILIAAGLTLLGVVYAISAVYMETGSFTISVNKYEMYEHGLSLSENRDLSKPSSILNAKVDKSITNIAEAEIDENVNQIDGLHNGKHYIAYTFYLFNAGDTEVNYIWQVRMSNVFNGIDEAIRLKLYVDDVPTTYAKTASDGSGAEPGTTEFYSNVIMAQGRKDTFTPGMSTKFTVVIWLEGTDPDCVDWIKGGQMKIEMVMSIAN